MKQDLIAQVDIEKKTENRSSVSEICATADERKQTIHNINMICHDRLLTERSVRESD